MLGRSRDIHHHDRLHSTNGDFALAEQSTQSQERIVAKTHPDKDRKKSIAFLLSKVAFSVRLQSSLIDFSLVFYF
ncbi:hypothetical protein EV363DRAFT_1220746, partial [Boletus edulis]